MRLTTDLLNKRVKRNEDIVGILGPHQKQKKNLDYLGSKV